MNSDYTTEELLSLSESSSDGGFQGDGIYDSESDATINETIVDNVRRRRNTFPVFRPVSNPDDLVFEKHMLFTSVKQFKEAITEYAVKGGWGVKFVKNDKVRVRAKCQPPCKFIAYLANQQPSTSHPASSNPTSNNPASSNLTSTNPSNLTSTNPRKRRRGTVTNETLTTSRNASRYKEALRSAGSQASVHGPRG
nr:hypothetical protein CFP56_66001 [Quercus suber]